MKLKLWHPPHVPAIIIQRKVIIGAQKSQFYVPALTLLVAEITSPYWESGGGSLRVTKISMRTRRSWNTFRNNKGRESRCCRVTNHHKTPWHFSCRTTHNQCSRTDGVSATLQNVPWCSIEVQTTIPKIILCDPIPTSRVLLVYQRGYLHYPPPPTISTWIQT